MSMDSISQGSSPRMGAMSEDQMSIRSCEELCSRIKLMCSYGGKIMPRPHDNQLRYIGGESRILVVNRNISFADFMAKLSKICGKEIAIKYQLPNEDLDALVSVLGEDDLESMIEEYDRLEARDSSSRLRLFLFPTDMKQQAQPQQNLMDFHEDNRNAEQRFVDAINGLNLGRNVEPARAIPQPVSAQLPDFLFGFEAREIRSPVQEQPPSQAHFTQQPWQQAVGPLITLQSSSPLVPPQALQSSSPLPPQAPASPPVSLKPQSPVGSLLTFQSSSPPLPPQKPASPPVSVKQQTTVGSPMTLQSSSPPLPPQMPSPALASPPASLNQQTPVFKPPISPSQNVGIIGQSVEEHPPPPEIPVSPPQAKVPSTPEEDKVGLPDLVLEMGETERKQSEALHTTDPKDVDGKNLFLDIRSEVELSNQDLQFMPDPSLQKELEILEKQPVKSPDKAQGISYEIKGEKQQESPGTNKEFRESPKKVLPKSPPLPPQHQERSVVLDALPTLPQSQQQERLITYDQFPQQQQQQQQQLQQERVVAYDQQQQHRQLVQQTERQLFDQDAPTTPPSFQQEPFSGILPRKVVLDPSLLPQHQQQAILQQAAPYQQVYANAIYWQAEDDSQHPQLQYESGLRSGNVVLQRVVPSQVPTASIQRLSSAPQMRGVQGVANNANLNRQFSAGYVDAYQQQQIQMQMQMQMLLQQQQQQQQQQQSPPVVQQQQQQSPPAMQPPLPQGKFSYNQQNSKNLHNFQPSPRLSPVKIQDQIGAERVIARPPASGTRAQQQPIAVDPTNDPTAYEPSAPQLHFIDKAPLAPQYVSSTPFPDLFKDAGIHHVYQEVPVSVEEGQSRRLAVHQVARGS